MISRAYFTASIVLGIALICILSQPAYAHITGGIIGTLSPTEVAPGGVVSVNFSFSCKSAASGPGSGTISARISGITASTTAANCPAGSPPPQPGSIALSIPSNTAGGSYSVELVCQSDCEIGIGSVMDSNVLVITPPSTCPPDCAPPPCDPTCPPPPPSVKALFEARISKNQIENGQAIEPGQELVIDIVLTKALVGLEHYELLFEVESLIDCPNLTEEERVGARIIDVESVAIDERYFDVLEQTDSSVRFQASDKDDVITGPMTFNEDGIILARITIEILRDYSLTFNLSLPQSDTANSSTQRSVVGDGNTRIDIDEISFRPGSYESPNSDRDCDGVPDIVDYCPDFPGRKETNGC